MRIVDESNKYALQVDITNLNLTQSELEQFIYELFLMSVVKMLNTHNYWNQHLQH